MRLFVGIPISEEVRGKIKEMMKELPKEGLKPVKPENLHFTLSFLEEREEGRVKSCLEKVDWGKRFEIMVRGVGVFPGEKRINTVWVGGEDKGRMAELSRKIDKALGIVAEKEFVNHLTLARVKFLRERENLRNFLKKYKNEELGKMAVTKVILYGSELTPEGPVYKVVGEFNLS